MKTKTRNLTQLKAEIKAAKAAHAEKFPRGHHSLSHIPLLYSRREIDSLTHIAWLEGYEQAVRDERGLK